MLQRHPCQVCQRRLPKLRQMLAAKQASPSPQQHWITVIALRPRRAVLVLVPVHLALLVPLKRLTLKANGSWLQRRVDTCQVQHRAGCPLLVRTPPFGETVLKSLATLVTERNGRDRDGLGENVDQRNLISKAYALKSSMHRRRFGRIGMTVLPRRRSGTRCLMHTQGQV